MSLIYLRKEATNDQGVLDVASGLLTRWDVVAYADARATRAVARWPWFSARKPAPRDKHVVIKGAKRVVAWLAPEAPEAAAQERRPAPKAA